MGTREILWKQKILSWKQEGWKKLMVGENDGFLIRKAEVFFSHVFTDPVFSLTLSLYLGTFK